MMAKKCTKKRDARAIKIVVCQSKPTAFFAVPVAVDVVIT